MKKKDAAATAAAAADNNNSKSGRNNPIAEEFDMLAYRTYNRHDEALSFQLYDRDWQKAKSANSQHYLFLGMYSI